MSDAGAKLFKLFKCKLYIRCRNHKTCISVEGAVTEGKKQNNNRTYEQRERK